MANAWGPTLYGFQLRLSESKTLKFECSFSYDENYNDSISFLLSFFPLIKNGTQFKYFIDNMDISQSILFLQNLLTGSIKEGIMHSRPNKKIYIRKETEHLYRLYMIIPDNNCSIDLSTKEVYNLLSIFEMLKSNYITISCLIYAGAVKHISNIRRNNGQQESNRYTPNKDIIEPLPINAVINSSKIETKIPITDDFMQPLSTVIQDVNASASQHNSEPSSKNNKDNIEDIVDKVFGSTANNDVPKNDNSQTKYAEHIGNSSTVNDLAKAIFN